MTKLFLRLYTIVCGKEIQDGSWRSCGTLLFFFSTLLSNSSNFKGKSPFLSSTLHVLCSINRYAFLLSFYSKVCYHFAIKFFYACILSFVTKRCRVLPHTIRS